MYLRNILLIVSTLIIGFCLSLYFQSDQSVQTVNWDQYKNLNYQDEKSNSLIDLNAKIHPLLMEELIQERLERNRLMGERTRVMEIGTGSGRILMELKRKFPEVEFYGINKEKTQNFYRRESYIATALKFEIMSRPEIEEIDLPYIVFQDLDFGRAIPYDAAKFDIIFTQDTISYIKYKFELFNEILRVLKPEGISLHTDVSGIKVYARGVVLSLRDALQEFRKRGLEAGLLEDKQSLRFKKSGDVKFSVTPHQPVPERVDNLSEDLQLPDMGYNLIL
jgi:SAM-dependent methyltransferase